MSAYASDADRMAENADGTDLGSAGDVMDDTDDMEDADDDAIWENVSAGHLRVVVSIDVEEEGLFSGSYARRDCTVRNVALLRKLAPITEELGFPLTLLCAHTVFTNAEACDTLAFMRDHAHAEIGAHLHHWSTPPLDMDGGNGSPQRTHLVPPEVVRLRLRTLLEAGATFQGAPLTSFRMGRWDLKACVRPLLAEEGILVDSSVCPLRVFWGKEGKEEKGADHFLAPADPYWPVDASGCAPLLESPITQIPLHPGLARLWYKMFRHQRRVDSLRMFAALSPNPVWHNSAVMRMAARLHMARGGRILHLFWHSSEMLAGGSPNVPDQAAADALLRKIEKYLRWLQEVHCTQGLTLSSLFNLDGFPSLPYAEARDW